MDSVMRLGASKAVVMFTKSTCCMSLTIHTLISSFGANPSVVEIDHHPNGSEMEDALMELGCDPSVPAVFIGNRFVGGSNEVMSLNVQGKLRPLLIKAKAIWV